VVKCSWHENKRLFIFGRFGVFEFSVRHKSQYKTYSCVNFLKCWTNGPSVFAKTSSSLFTVVILIINTYYCIRQHWKENKWKVSRWFKCVLRFIIGEGPIVTNFSEKKKSMDCYFHNRVLSNLERISKLDASAVRKMCTWSISIGFI